MCCFGVVLGHKYTNKFGNKANKTIKSANLFTKTSKFTYFFSFLKKMCIFANERLRDYKPKYIAYAD